jgi:hypothetical protein
MQLVLWAQPADTLRPDIYEFQRRLLDPIEDRGQRILIAREISRFTADPPAKRLPLGAASWVMRWQDRLNWTPLFRALADIRTTPSSDEMAPNAITMYVIFDVASSAARVCTEAADRLSAFAETTGQHLSPNVMRNLLEALASPADFERRAGLLGRLASPPQTGVRHDVRHLDKQTQIGTRESE